MSREFIIKLDIYECLWLHGLTKAECERAGDGADPEIRDLELKFKSILTGYTYNKQEIGQ